MPNGAGHIATTKAIDAYVDNWPIASGLLELSKGYGFSAHT